MKAAYLQWQHNSGDIKKKKVMPFAKLFCFTAELYRAILAKSVPKVLEVISEVACPR